MKIFGNSGRGEQPRYAASFWNFIEDEAGLERAIADSFEQPVVIFKHSTRCMVSKMVLKNFEAEAEKSNRAADFYFLDILAHRDLSNKISKDLGVEHQSPQLIILRDGKPVKDASHEAISLKLLDGLH